MCAQRGHLPPAVRLQAVPCIQTPRETTSRQHPYTRTQSQRPKRTTVQRPTCEHTTPAYPESCVHSYSHMCTQHNHPQSTHLHTCFHTRVLIHSLVRRAGSDLGTWRPGAGKYLVTLPQDHPGASHCHQAIVVWAAPASLELTENRVRRREVFLGRGHVTSRREGAHHPIGEVRMASTLPCGTHHRPASSR